MRKLSDRAVSLPVSAALAVDLRAKELARQGKKIINFSVGEPDFPTPSVVQSSGKDAIDSGKTKYTNASGTDRLKEAVCDMYNSRYATKMGKSSIAVTTGGKYAVYAAACTLADPGDEIILPAPYWNSYYEIIRLAGAVPVVAQTDMTGGWKLTPELLESLVTDRTKAVILNNPGNPSGAVYRKNELKELYKVIASHDLYVICDEIYDHFVFDGNFTGVLSLGEDICRRTVLVNGVSKSYSMTGWRIGFIAANEAIIGRISAFLSHTSGCPSAVSQEAAITAIRQCEADAQYMCSVFRKRRDLIVRGLSGVEGIEFAVPEGAFYLMPRLTGRLAQMYKDAADFSMELLENAGVAVVPCADYGVPGGFRISFSVSEDDIAEGITKIRNFIEEKLKQ